MGLCFDKVCLSVDKAGLLMAVIIFLDKSTLLVDKPTLSKHKLTVCVPPFSCEFDNVGYFL